VRWQPLQCHGAIKLCEISPSFKTIGSLRIGTDRSSRFKRLQTDFQALTSQLLAGRKLPLRVFNFLTIMLPCQRILRVFFVSSARCIPQRSPIAVPSNADGNRRTGQLAPHLARQANQIAISHWSTAHRTTSVPPEKGVRDVHFHQTHPSRKARKIVSTIELSKVERE
jgi:hypothetical protein